MFDHGFGILNQGLSLPYYKKTLFEALLKWQILPLGSDPLCSSLETMKNVALCMWHFLMFRISSLLWFLRANVEESLVWETGLIKLLRGEKSFIRSTQSRNKARTHTPR